MNAAMLLAALAGCGWAINIVVVRWALGRTGAPSLVAASVGVTFAALVAASIAVAAGEPLPGIGDLWRFWLVGVVAPGGSQGMFVAAIGLIGSSRASVLIGTSPAWSVALAVIFLGEPLQALVVLGTLLTVVGGAVISWEPGGAGKRLGVVLALGTALSFATRDVVARQFSGGSDVSAWWAGAVVLAAASTVLWAMALVGTGAGMRAGVRASLPEFVWSGVAIGLTLPTLLEALDRGRVGVVAPLSLAAQNVAVVALGAVVFGSRERTGRVLAAVALIIAGAGLVSAS
jgi:O-acetylserine/cysteine efflux transporter